MAGDYDPPTDRFDNWSHVLHSGENANVRIHKFSDADGFVAIDLTDADRAIGIVRRAKKILQGGAKDLARSLTYGFASHELKYSGASAGLNGIGEGSEGLIDAFVAEVGPMVEAATFLPDPGKGVSEDDIAALRQHDPRSALRLSERNGLRLQDELVGHSVAAAAAAALGGALDGRTFAIEGFDINGLAVARALLAGGAQINGISTADGSISQSGGIDIEALATALGSDGAEALAGFGETQPANRIFGHDVDALTVASKMGCCNHHAVEYVKAKAIVPAAPMTITAKALAMLRRADVAAMPDFISTGGPITLWSNDPADADAAVAAASETATAISTDVMGHEDGPLLGACYRAEAFLATWQDEMPFGRPLAS